MPILLVLLCHREWLDFQCGWELKDLSEAAQCSLLARARHSRLTALKLVFESSLGLHILECSPLLMAGSSAERSISCTGYMLKPAHPRPGFIAWQGFLNVRLTDRKLLGKISGKFRTNTDSIATYPASDWLESGSSSIRLCTVAT